MRSRGAVTISRLAASGVFLAILLLPGTPGTARAADALDAVIKKLSWTRYAVEYDFIVQREQASPLKKAMRVIASDDAAGQRILATFTYPQNMKGTSFLAITDRAAANDEYYMFVRTLRRVKRVPNSTENFMLRDFLSLYFLKPRAELWDFTLVDTSTLKGTARDDIKAGELVIDGTPAMERTAVLTGYGRIRHVVDAARQRILRTDFFDEGGRLVRQQKVLEYKRIDDHDVPWRFETHDLLEGVRATIEMRSIDFSPELSKDSFSLRYLKRL